MTLDLLVVTHLSVALLGLVLVPLILKACSYDYIGRRLLGMTREDDDVAMCAYKVLDCSPTSAYRRFQNNGAKGVLLLPEDESSPKTRASQMIQ
jgi:hypothetical protein